MHLLDEIEMLMKEGYTDVSPETRYVFRSDTTRFSGIPEIVVNVKLESEVAGILAIASKHGLSVTARGAGTGMSGGAVPIKGGILINFENMNKIRFIDRKRKIAFVEPGVVTDQLRNEVSKYSLFYPPDPSSSAVSTLGGNFAENAGGLHCVKYGVTSRYVKGFRFVDSKGNILSCGSAYENTPDPGSFVMIGSEGTLGIVTEIALELIDNPPVHDTYISYHNDLISAVSTSIRISNSRVVPSVMELIDKEALLAAKQYSDIFLPNNTEAVLIIKTDSQYLPDLIERSLVLEKIFSFMKVPEWKKARDDKEEESFWNLRKSVSSSIKRIAPDKMNEDITVPVTAMFELIEFTRSVSEKYGLRIVVYGHSGDGNLHVNILYDRKNDTELNNARLASEDIFKKAVVLGGNITGEHGIGLSKKSFLGIQLSKNEIAFMKKVKKAFDPDNILNPDKIFNMSKGQ